MKAKKQDPETTPDETEPLTTPEEEPASKALGIRVLCSKSPNVPRMIAYNCLDGIAFSVWNITAAQLVIYRVSGNSNSAVGWVSGVTGAAQVLSAILGSYYADKGKRETITQAGVACGLLAVTLTILAAYYELEALFYASGILWGYYMGFCYPASEALFADSVPSGQRTAIYSYKWSLGTVSYVFGYILNMVLFAVLGGHWGNEVVKTVLYCGVSLSPLAFFALLGVRDKYSLGKESESLVNPGKARPGSTTRGAGSDDEDARVTNGIPPPQRTASGTAKEAVGFPRLASPNRHHLQRGPRSGPRALPGSERSMGSEENSDHALGADNGGKPHHHHSRHQTSSRHFHGDSAVEGDGNGHPSADHFADGEGGLKNNSFSRTNIRHLMNSQKRNSGEGNGGDGSKGDGSPTTNGDASLEREEKSITTPKVNEETNEDIDWEASFLCLRANHVPFMLVAGDVFSSIGAGMTIRFFPLFFINNYNVNPTLFNAMYATIMVLTAIIATGIQRLAKTRCGRVPSMLLVRLLGASFLFYMAFATGEIAAGEGLILGAWVLRSSLMNSPVGMSRSVIMDYVPKSQRTKWNAFESVTSFTWAGSAVLGGYLVDSHGYRFTFAITAAFQIAACAICLPSVILTRSVDVAAAERREREAAEEKRKKNSSSNV